MDISSPRSPRKDGDCENKETEQLKFNNSNKLLIIYVNVDSLLNILQELKCRISRMHPKLHLEVHDEIFHFEIFKNFVKILKYFKTPLLKYFMKHFLFSILSDLKLLKT